jgi:transcriptional regulator with XRE-family HTH domain
MLTYLDPKPTPTVSAIDELAKRLRAARGYAGLSQEGLAAQVGISPATLKRVESGQRSLRRFERQAFIAAVADATGLPVRWFTVDFETLAAPESLSEAVPRDPEWFEAKVRDALSALQDALAGPGGGRVQLEGAEATGAGTPSAGENALAQPLEELAQGDLDQPRRSARARHGPPKNRRAG